MSTAARVIGADTGLADGKRFRMGWARGVRWALVSLMIAAGLAWILCMPYNEEAIWRAVPANAVYFSRHEHAADRWDTLVRNPLTMTIFRSLGLEPETLRTDQGDPATVRWIQRLFGRDVLLAYVPAMGPGGEPAWVFSSWIGNRAQRLRWMLALGRFPGVQPVRFPGQPVFWKWLDAAAGNEEHISLALTDGLLLGAISADPSAVRYLTATWNRQAGYSSLGGTAWRETAERQVDGQAVADWGAYALRASAGPHDQPTSLFPVLHRLEPAFAAGEVIGSFRISAVARVDPTTPSLDGLAALLDDAPVFWTLVSPALLTSLTRQPYTPRWAVTLAHAMLPPAMGNEADDEPRDMMHDDLVYPLFVGVLDDRYAGSVRDVGGGLLSAWIRGLTVPAIVAGLHVGDEATADAVFMNLLDQLNREYRLGLIPRRAPGERVTVIEDTRSGTSFYDRLLLQERVGVVYHDGWLLFAGQSSVLERLIDRRWSDDEAAPRADQRWLPVAGNDTALAYCWVDMDDFGTLAHDALAAVSLMSLVRDPDASLDLRRGLADVQAWIKGLRPLRQGRLWIDASDSRFHLKFTLGASR